MTERIYDSDGIQLWHGRWQDVFTHAHESSLVTSLDLDSNQTKDSDHFDSALAFLRSRSVLVSDPPYGTGGWRRHGSGQGKDLSGSLYVEEWDDGDVEFVESGYAGIVTFWPPAHTLRLLQRAQEVGYEKHRQLCIEKPNPKPMVGGRTRWSLEPVWVLSNEGFVLFGGTDLHRSVMPRKNRDPEGNGHPYQKSISSMIWLLEKIDKNSVVIDPFMGSGTTIVAAKMLGMKAIGVEQDREWCGVALDRMQQSVLFSKATPPPVQQSFAGAV